MRWHAEGTARVTEQRERKGEWQRCPEKQADAAHALWAVVQSLDLILSLLGILREYEGWSDTKTYIFKRFL